MRRLGLSFLLGLTVGAIAIVATTYLGTGAVDRSQFIPPKGKYDVKILRDTYGVPHIFGKRDVDTAYGLGFAHAEDDWVNTRDALLVTRGKMASIHGKDFADYDFILQAFRVREFVHEKYATISPDVRAVVEAYAEGATHAAALHPERSEGVVLPVTGEDIVAGATFKSPFFYEFDKLLKDLFAGKHVPSHDASAKTASLENGGFFSNGLPMGSNAFAVGPKRSADGKTRFMVNSHQPWEGQVTWYEANLHSEEGWNMCGATFPGGPVIFEGFDESKGWCHTINRPDLADVYTLEINPANPEQYKFDGQWKDFEHGTANITVKLLGPIHWTFHRDLRWSVHGPVIDTPNGRIAVHFAGYGEVRALEQWFRMNKAKNLDEFKAAMKLQYLPSLNTLYADKSGSLFYVYNGQFHKRPEGYDWSEAVPGNTSVTLWGEAYPFEQLPQMTNPASGLLWTCNNDPFYCTDSPDNIQRANYPATMGLETYITNRAYRCMQTFGKDPSITRDEFLTYKYDTEYAPESHMGKFQARLAAAPASADPLTQRAVALVKGWNRRTDRDNTAAALAILAAEPGMEWQRQGKYDFDPVEAVARAAKYLQEHFGKIEVPWGELMRIRRGGVDMPLDGGPDTLRAIEGLQQKDGTYTANDGDCYISLVEWAADGSLQAESVHQYGAATVDTASKHYADQAPLFAERKMKPVWLTEAEVRQHLEREYRPGE